jgi:hypothetical protein
MGLAFLKQDLRDVVIESLSALIGDDNSMSADYRSHLVLQLANLHAKECLVSVKDACLRFAVTNYICGYSDFLCLCGLPIYLNDEAVIKDVNNPNIPVSARKLAATVKSRNWLQQLLL